jgi:hypothetical protein
VFSAYFPLIGCTVINLTENRFFYFILKHNKRRKESTYLLRTSEQLILIGSLGRNSGKTTLAAELVRLWKDRFPVTALKVTPTERKSGECRRGTRGCGACSGFAGNFLLEEASDGSGEKDTDLLVRAGARRVFWIRSLRANLEEAFAAFLEKAPADSLIICESNSLARLLRPACFVMLAHSKDHPGKPGARELIGKADIALEGSYTLTDIAGIAAKIKVKEAAGGTPQVCYEK